MKQLRYILLAGVLASGSTFAQTAVPLHEPGFALTHQTMRNVPAPGHAAAIQALKRFAHASSAMHGPQAGFPEISNHTLQAPFVQAPRLAKSIGPMNPQRQTAPPAGFPLAVQNMADLGQLQIGWGFAVYDVMPGNLLSGGNLDGGAQPTDEWRYAVMLHGKPVGLVTMARVDGKWTAVSFGGAKLSENIGHLVTRYGQQHDVQMRYVRVRQATSDFIEIKRRAMQPQFVPLHAAQASLHLKTSSPRLGAELLPDLREAVRHNLTIRH